MSRPMPASARIAAALERVPSRTTRSPSSLEMEAIPAVSAAIVDYTVDGTHATMAGLEALANVAVTPTAWSWS